ncbi:MAG: gamma-glutamyl-gamma-aminobutyrate hydrolase family protein [Myxococcota bacterium]
MKSVNKPIIGITRGIEDPRFPWLAIAAGVIMGGGIPQKITPLKTDKLSKCAGIILSGGSDIHPSFYGEKVQQGKSYDLQRDQFEFDLMGLILKKQLPVLGICRGMQMLNIARGGTLYQEVDSQFDDFVANTTLWKKIIARREVLLQSDSCLNRALQQNTLQVNSLHHQAVNKLGTGFKITAREKGGLIQAIESISPLPFILGVQWHPEYILHKKGGHKIFKLLINKINQSR